MATSTWWHDVTSVTVTTPRPQQSFAFVVTQARLMSRELLATATSTLNNSCSSLTINHCSTRLFCGKCDASTLQSTRISESFTRTFEELRPVPPRSLRTTMAAWRRSPSAGTRQDIPHFGGAALLIRVLFLCCRPPHAGP